MIPCMGGWCNSRGRCANYYAESAAEPVERLCGQVEEPDKVDRQADERRKQTGYIDGLPEKG